MNLRNSHLIIAAAVIFLITLFFGLRPKGYDFSNHAEWLPDTPGIHFSRHAIAFAYLDLILNTFGALIGAHKLCHKISGEEIE